MSSKTPSRLPKYRHHKPQNLAVVQIDGQDRYLGRYDSNESHAEYRRILGEWLATGISPRQPISVAVVQPTVPTINEIMLSYTVHVDGYYVKGGRFSRSNIHFACSAISMGTRRPKILGHWL